MTSAETTAPETTPVRRPKTRMVQGALLVAGAVLLALTAGSGRISFFWVPLFLGVIYLVTAAAGGPRGGYWATALALTGWGLAIAWTGEIRPERIDTAGAYLAGVGLAGVAASLLRRRGFVISDLGLAATIAASGIILAVTPRAVDTLADAGTYAWAVGVVGVLNVVGGAVQLRRGPQEAHA